MIDEAALPDWWSTTSSALDDKMGLQVTELTAQRTVGSMPVEGNTQPYGLWHGGASGVLAETLASIASYAHAQPGGMAVGVDLNVTHHRPARAGRVTGVATALHLGRRVTSYEVVISHESGVRVATARVTCHVLRPGHDDPDPA
ncbi:PaaI family thioesterase [Microlunatus antarcticus]|uniref:Uncharacterized protein (TIGR00369 family) n=1 Tax=Microlunatus antarcticus TaxID=53388 RepID=A0A7W5JY26_9ACTN|nr:uncharacterized protein (TIGR00369 family) [Microlunatus antarcticus]